MPKDTTRTEKDTLGTQKVPSDAYYGAFTARALNNFQISGLRAPEVFRKTLGLIKKTAAETNIELKTLEEKLGEAIISASTEFLEGKFDQDFTLDVIQAGAGTSFNMNANEIIANQANTQLGGEKGTYNPIHPNNHVNLGQSSNDTMPSVTKLSALTLLKELIEEAKKLEESLNSKAKEFQPITKVGRTHLQDAVPISLGQEFDAYKVAIARARRSVERASADLHEIGLGGTAVGTGLNAHPEFGTTMVKKLSAETGLKLTNPSNLTETANNYAPFAEFANSLQLLGSVLYKIAMDLKLLSSGPDAGIHELILPKAQPGSSIMPGKINPSIPETVEMAFYQVAGNSETVRLAAMNGQLELNSNSPVIMYNLLQSEEILTNTLRMFRTKCIDGIIANKERIKELYDSSNCEATKMVPELGYDKVAEMVKNGEFNGKKK